MSWAPILLDLLRALLVSGASAHGSCGGWSEAEKIGHIKAKKIQEASGLAVSRGERRVFWTMNDDAGDRRLFALSAKGKLLAQLEVPAPSLDREALSMGPCRDARLSCIYVADIGDNHAVRDSVFVVRFPEPRWLLNGKKGKKGTARQVELARFAYADGKPRDAEALMVDAAGTLWVFDKKEGQTSLFRARFERGLKPGAQLVRVATREDIGFVTGGDLAPDGRRFLVRDAKRAYEFQVPPGVDIASAFRQPFAAIELKKEQQGEAIAYAPGGTRFFTLSEGKKEPIYRYEQRATCR